MIAQFIVYGSAVTVCVALAGLALERVMMWRARPLRWVWLSAFIVSFVLPAVMTVAPHEVPSATVKPLSATLQFSVEAPWTVNSTTGSTSDPVLDTPNTRLISTQKTPSFLDTFLRSAWIVASAALLSLYTFSWLMLRNASRTWYRDVVGGQEVWITSGHGPAVFGFLNPRILLPSWALDAPAATQALVVTHEREHIEARDTWLLLLGLLITALVPWNLPLWWQFRRLRFAIEVDCDARVIGRGVGVRTYGEALLSIRQRAASAPMAAIAMYASASNLERRVRVLVGATRRRGKLLIGALATLSISLVMAATHLSAPQIEFGPDLRKLPPQDLSPGAHWAKEAARARFPELFDQTIDGTVVVSIVFNRDGSVLAAQKARYTGAPPAAALDYFAAARAAGAEEQDVGYGGCEDPITIGPWLQNKNANRINVIYAVLRWPIDPSRSAARVVRAVRDRFPDLNRGDAATKNHYLSVFMNADGTVGRAREESLASLGKNIATMQTLEHLTTLGVDAENVGRRGWTSNGHLFVYYGWPRMPDDTPSDMQVYLPSVSLDTSHDQAIVERHFPNASTVPLGKGEHRWLLLDRDGNIWAAGRSSNGRLNTDTETLEARFPGIKVSQPWSGAPSGLNCLGSTETEKKALRTFCFYLAPDSPISELATVDLNNRPDVFLVATVPIGDIPGSLRRQTTVPLRFGTTSISGRPFQRWNFTAQRVSNSQVDITVHMRSLQSPETTVGQASIRLNTDEEGILQVSDENSRTWQVSLKPIVFGTTI